LEEGYLILFVDYCLKNKAVSLFLHELLIGVYQDLLYSKLLDGIGSKIKDLVSICNCAVLKNQRISFDP
jgi:hypothetical protein